jgi:hypothetical protein
LGTGDNHKSHAHHHPKTAVERISIPLILYREAKQLLYAAR